MADFGLLNQPQNFFASAQNAFLAGQQQAQHKRTVNALAANASDPQNLPNALLQAGDLQGATQAQQFNTNADTQTYQHEQHAAQVAGLQRQGTVRQAIQAGDIQGAYKAAAGDPEAMKMVDAAGQHVTDTVQALANIGASLKTVPYGPERTAMLQQQAGQLKARGLDPSIINGFDPTDANIDAQVAQVTSLKDQFEQNKPVSIAPGATALNPRTQQPVYTAPANPINVPAGGTLVRPGAPGAQPQTLFESPYKPMTIRNGDGSTSLVQPGSPGGATGSPGGGGLPHAEMVGSALSHAIPGLVVSSAGRTPGHNAAVGGVPNSMHVSDTAVDVVLPKGVTTAQVVAQVSQWGVNPTEVINEGDHLHIGWAPKGNAAPAPAAGGTVIAKGEAGPFKGVNSDDAAILTKAVGENRVDSSRINSRTAPVFAAMLRINPNLNMVNNAGIAALAKNAPLQQKAMMIDLLPTVLQNVRDSGKKMDFSKFRPLGSVQAAIKAYSNDPDFVNYMNQRNDAVQTLSQTMRGAGATDLSTKLESEAMHVALSPDAFDGWFKGQMAALDARQKQFGGIKVSPNGSGAPRSGAPTGNRPALSDIFGK